MFRALSIANCCDLAFQIGTLVTNGQGRGKERKREDAITGGSVVACQDCWRAAKASRQGLRYHPVAPGTVHPYKTIRPLDC